MLVIYGSGCSGSSFRDSEDYWQKLRAPEKKSQNHLQQPSTGQQSIDELLESAYQDLKKQENISEEKNLSPIDRIILVSTKGSIDERVWQENFQPSEDDTITKHLSYFKEQNHFIGVESLVISQACSGFLVGLELAKLLLSEKKTNRVLLLAVDSPGRFVKTGFALLGALSSGTTAPFGAQRQGFELGAAALCFDLVDSSQLKSDGLPYLSLPFVETACEVSSLARPKGFGSHSCKLIRKAVSRHGIPDLVIAHGTATKANDLAEDEIFQEALPPGQKITASKWLSGHCLGASAGLDLLAASLMLRNNEFTEIPEGADDPKLGGHYLRVNSKKPRTYFPVNKILIHSLGFGGTLGLALLEKTQILDQAASSQNKTPSKVKTRNKPPAFLRHSQRLKTLFYPVEFKKDQPPAWASLIDRWSQLDEASFWLAQSLYSEQLAIKPDLELILILTTPSASNRADRDFARQPSPAKFIYTLPSVRAAIVMQVLKKQVAKLFCIQNASDSWQKGKELLDFLLSCDSLDCQKSQILLIGLEDLPPLPQSAIREDTIFLKEHFRVDLLWSTP